MAVRRGARFILPAVILAGLASAIALADFHFFCLRAANAVPSSAPEKADALVTLTGGAGKRIAAAISLLEAGSGDRLLVSGVNPDVTLAEMQALAGGRAETWACCVDIGRRARTTIGNAAETADWVTQNRYTSIYLVTSDYHLPRSLIELSRAMPGVTLHPYPVRTRHDPSKVWRDPVSLRTLSGEWLKWRFTQVRRGRAA